MTTAATIAVKLLLDSSQYDEGLDRSEQKTSAFSSKMAGIGQAMTKAGTAMTAGLTVPLVGLGIKAVDSASNVEEAMNAMNVVFGEGSSAVQEYAKTSATSVGLAQSEFLQMSAVTGAFLTNLGYDQEAAADKTLELTERAADMASIFNTDVDQALGAIQSGLKGEFNPLESFGVKMNAAAIEAKALSMGLVNVSHDAVKIEAAQIKYEKAQSALNAAIKKYGSESFEAREAQNKLEQAQESVSKAMAGNTDEITDNAKAQAALALIMEQTEKLSGDFANTSDGLANSTRIAKAQFEDALALLGQQFIPIASKVVSKVSEIITQFMNLNPEVRKWIAIGMAVVAGLGPLLMALGSLITIVSTVAGVIGGLSSGVLLPIILVIATLAAGVAILTTAWKNNWGGIQEKTAAVWNWLKPIFQSIWEWLKTNIPAAIQTLADFWNNVLSPAIQTVWEWFEKNLLPLFKEVGEYVINVLVYNFKIWAGVFNDVIIPALSDLWGWIDDKVLPVFKKVGDFIYDKLAPAFSWLGDMIQKITDKFATMNDGFSNFSVPSLITPGSPTPLEIGLRGIRNELGLLSKSSLPEFQSGLNLNTSGSSAQPSFGNISVSVTIQGNASETDVRNGVNLGIQDALRSRGQA